MVAHGFKIEMLVEMVRAEFASVATERLVAGGLKMEVAGAYHRGGAAGAGGSR